MENAGKGEGKVMEYLESHFCLVCPIPNGYRVEYWGSSNLEWQEALLWMSSLDGYSTRIANLSSAFLFRL